MYEDLRNSEMLSLDLETYDPDLADKTGPLKYKMGPGVFRSQPLDFSNSNGYILGVSMGNEAGKKAYYDLAHPGCTKELRDKNLRYVKEQCSKQKIIIGQNLMYDLDWLEHWAQIPVNGNLIDIGVAEALLDENQGRYSLDFMGEKYFNEGKAKSKPQEFCDKHNLKSDMRKHLYLMPHSMVEEYAIQDIVLPMRIWAIQEKMLKEQDLDSLMRLECDLQRVLLQMRKTGVLIDNKQREKNVIDLTEYIDNKYRWLKEKVGTDFNVNSSKHLTFVLNEFKIPTILTDKGNPSVKNDYLQLLANGQLRDENNEMITDELRMSIGQNIVDLRKSTKNRDTFLDGSLERFRTEGDLIHCSFFNMRTEKNGTRSGRFSGANPNLQQIPSLSTNEYLGRLARQCFLPFEDCWWGKLDYSQIEYRVMAHFAVGKGADEVRAKYNDDPSTDYHRYIQELTNLTRKLAKNLNFGVAFGMGAKGMSEFFQWDIEYCYEVLNTYHANAPFVKATVSRVQNVAKSRGYIKTFLKRRARLIDPQKAYVMFSRLIQGTAADIMKQAMYDVYKAGVFNVLAPHLTVHDEIDVSIPKTKEGIEAFDETRRIMESCISLKIPVKADMEIGRNWADIVEVKDTDLRTVDAYNMLVA